MKEEPGQTYAQSGVDYAAMDPIKVLAQRRAAVTAPNLAAFGAQEVAASRGESAYVWEESDAYRALVIEGLGTKNLIADAVRKSSGRTHYDTIAQDAVAMIVNDLIVVGALPQVVNAYFAIGSSDWLKDEERSADLINGWATACNAIGATWGGGETPTLKGIIDPDTIDIGGSAIGVINSKDRLVLGDKLTTGDTIVLVESSGIHANGITLVRSLAEQQSGIYQEKLSDDRTFGQALLTPTHLYVNLVRELLDAKLDLHYMANITGHGWRKLMRANQTFTYKLHNVPPVPPEFTLIQERAGVDAREMYGNYNMGAGFAIYLPQPQAQKAVDLAAKLQLKAWVAGSVEKGSKQVVIEPKGIIFNADSLEVR